MKHYLTDYNSARYKDVCFRRSFNDAKEKQNSVERRFPTMKVIKLILDLMLAKHSYLQNAEPNYFCLLLMYANIYDYLYYILL